MGKTSKNALIVFFVLALIFSTMNMACLSAKDELPLLEYDGLVGANLRYGIYLVSTCWKIITAVGLMAHFWDKKTAKAVSSNSSDSLTKLFNTACHVQSNNKKRCGLTFFIYLVIGLCIIIAAPTTMLILSGSWEAGLVTTTTDGTETSKMKDWSTEENYELVYSLDVISNAALIFLFGWYLTPA